MRKWSSILAVVALVGVLAGCGQKDTLADVQKKGTLVLGTSADYPPYEFHKSINGKDEIVGFDIEIAKEVAKDLGVKLEIKDMKFDGLLASLKSGNVDIVMAGMTPDEERKKSVDFTKIYYTAEQGIVVRAEDADKFKTMEDLKGLKIGAQKGAVQEKIATEQIPNAQVKPLGKISDLMLELKNKKVDALVVELPVANSYVAKNKDLALSPAKPKDDVGGSAIAANKGNAELIDKMNATIDRLEKDKTIDKLVTEAIELVE
ncbi:amino acid ABC transporter [Paenibacillus sp. J31TS4]|uniref:ABC transporter substrate-binding protein n=1 Tax=Paenibacillus sp. J31TS4 TaxID=2807195 RepID=UPI001B298B96|nr:ABC transporter substrate-binding protein [Paenibacillus sp. J31TS4]GIP37217.1 amino acid ABC transporter [Paenibacillus sp. J31TS4]